MFCLDYKSNVLSNFKYALLQSVSIKSVLFNVDGLNWLL